MSSNDNYYENPVLTGFFPDPSAIRAGYDCCLVNSAFRYFPAVVIPRSRDLAHWRIIGRAITGNEA
jgi:xylan 1,4-beta-xylosidase